MKGDSCYRSVARNFRVVQWLKFNDDMVIIGSIKCIKYHVGNQEKALTFDQFKEALVTIELKTFQVALFAR